MWPGGGLSDENCLMDIQYRDLQAQSGGMSVVFRNSNSYPDAWFKVIQLMDECESTL